MAERVLVTGAAGQIGLALVRALAEAGHTVTGLVRGDGAAVEAAGGEVLKGDLYQPEVLRAAVSTVERVYHLAGGVRGKGKEDADRMNRVGTGNLLEAVKPEIGRLKSFVFASSCAVYGDRNGLWVTESHKPSPHTAYGQSKLAAEALLQATPGLPLRIARIGAVYGKDIRFTMVDRMKAGRAWLPGEGLNYLPVVHLDDCVAALIAIAERGQDGAIYNVSGRSTPLLKEFYAEVHKVAGGTPLRFWSTWIPSAIQFRLATSNEKMASAMGRKPRFTPDNLRLYTAGVRLKTDRLEKELGFTWRYGDFKEGVKASV